VRATSLKTVIAIVGSRVLGFQQVLLGLVEACSFDDDSSEGLALYAETARIFEDKPIPLC